MQPKLEGFAAALVGSLDSAVLATVASDFAALEQTILSNPDLHGMLTDTSIAPVARGRVFQDLLDGRVHAVTARLAVYAARVVPAQDVPHAIADLASSIHLIQETGTQEFASLGLLAARERISGYTDALLDQVDTSNFTQVEEDLFRWAHIVRNNQELRRLLSDRDAPLDQRLAITQQLLEGKVLDIALTLIRFVVVGGRPRDVTGSIDYLVDYIAKARDWRVARIHTARPLDEQSRSQLVSSLAAVTGTSVELQIARDPSLLGGLLIEVGDLRLDATTRGRLGVLRESVAAGHYAPTTSDRNE